LKPYCKNVNNMPVIIFIKYIILKNICVDTKYQY